MKKLLALMISAIAVTAIAGNVQASFQYYDGDLQPYGFNAVETYDVAICIDNPALTGLKIKSISAYVAPQTAAVATAPQMWLSSELKLKYRVNAPDIATYTPTIQRVTVDENYYGLMTYTLDEPYELTGEPLYVGYSITIKDVTTEAAGKPVLISQQAQTDGFWLHTTKNVLDWTDCSATAGGAAAISIELEGNVPDYRVDVASMPLVYVENGKEFILQVPLVNTGSEPISTFSYSYQVDGGDMQYGLSTPRVPLTTSFGAGTGVPFSFISIDEAGDHTLTVTLNEINGHPNTSDANTRTIELKALPLVPRHLTLVEEFTGLYCRYCPRGWIIMEQLNENYYRDQVSLIWHNYPSSRDAMYPEFSSSYYIYFNSPCPVQSYPSKSLNRSGNATNDYSTAIYYGKLGNGLANDVLQLNAELTPAAIDVTATRDGDIITARADVSFIEDMDTRNYKIGFVLACNGLYDASWGQVNGYAGVPPYSDPYYEEGSPLEIVAKMGNPIRGLTYNFVVADASAASGISNSLPSTARMGEVYSAQKTFDISKIDVTRYMQDPEDFMIAAYVIYPDNTICNAAKFSFVPWPYENPEDNSGSDDPAGIEEVMTSQPHESDVYYNLQGIRITNLTPGQIYIHNGRKKIAK